MKNSCKLYLLVGLVQQLTKANRIAYIRGMQVNLGSQIRSSNCAIQNVYRKI